MVDATPVCLFDLVLLDALQVSFHSSTHTQKNILLALISILLKERVSAYSTKHPVEIPIANNRTRHILRQNYNNSVLVLTLVLSMTIRCHWTEVSLRAVSLLCQAAHESAKPACRALKCSSKVSTHRQARLRSK